MRLTGFICSWNASKYLGRIVADGKPTRRYFFYGNAVVDGPEPSFLARVEFEVSDKPVKLGQLPHAVNIVVLELNVAGIEALKGAQ